MLSFGISNHAHRPFNQAPYIPADNTRPPKQMQGMHAFAGVSNEMPRIAPSPDPNSARLEQHRPHQAPAGWQLLQVLPCCFSFSSASYLRWCPHCWVLRSLLDQVPGRAPRSEQLSHRKFVLLALRHLPVKKSTGFMMMLYRQLTKKQARQQVPTSKAASRSKALVGPEVAASGDSDSELAASSSGGIGSTAARNFCSCLAAIVAGWSIRTAFFSRVNCRRLLKESLARFPERYAKNPLATRCSVSSVSRASKKRPRASPAHALERQNHLQVPWPSPSELGVWMKILCMHLML